MSGWLKNDSIKGIMNSVLKTGNNSLFYSFSNADGKQWIMPRRNMRTAMNLYQPSGWSGKLVKWLMPWLYWLPKVWRVANTERLNCSLREDLQQKLYQIFNCNDLEFAIFCGTPGTRTKITIQLFQGDNIIGYCKVSDKDEIIAMFHHEKRILDSLHTYGIKSIPHCLYIGTIDKLGTTIFVQTTKKSSQSKTTQVWDLKHDNFLKQLHKNTVCKMPFNETDYYKIIKDFETNINIFPDDERKLFKNAIEVVSSYYSNYNEYSAFHGDFTPWNIFIESGDLFAFDLEYAQLSFPPYLDYFHYILQVALIVKHYNYEEAYNYTIKHMLMTQLPFCSYRISLLAYIVFIIALYFKLFQDNIFTHDKNYRTRYQLIKKLIEDLDKSLNDKKV